MYLSSGQSETAATPTNFYNLRYQQQQQHQQQHHQHQHQQHQHSQHGNAYNMSSAFSSALMANASNEFRHSGSTISGQRSSTIGAVAVLPGAFNAAAAAAAAATALNHSFFADRQKLKSLGDSSQELDSSTNSSLGSGSRHVIAIGNERHLGCVSAHSSGCGSGSGSGGAGEMTDNQRSFSEGRLVDSDYGRDGLSQSHDSVFSESATASSLSIVLKAELADALRKRRNRPDVSDEDLGLPRSPASPQRRSTAGHTSTPTAATGNHSEVSSLSMLSMNSNDGDGGLSFSDILISNSLTQERSQIGNLSNSRHSRISTLSSLPLSSDIVRPSSVGSIKSDTFGGEIDMISSDWQRLSHSAARHKMAIRPSKKKGPSRKHRRILETSIPEANEELFKMGGDHIFDVINQDTDATDSTNKDPTDVNNYNISDSKKYPAESLSKMEISTVTGSNNYNNNSTETISKVSERPHLVETPSAPGLHNNNHKVFHRQPDVSFYTNSLGSRVHSSKSSPIVELYNEAVKITPDDETTSPAEGLAVTESAESGFLHRLIQRNSKRTFSKAVDDTTTDTQSGPKKLQISTSAYDTREVPKSPNLEKCLSATDYDQQLEQTRKEIKRELLCDGNGMLSSLPDTERMARSNTNIYIKDNTSSSSSKPKSGAAARQRYLPQEITANETLERSTRNGHSKSLPMETFSNTALSSKSSSINEETFQSTSIIRQITSAQCDPTTLKPEHHFEKKPKIIGLSSFQQKISRTNDTSYNRTNSNQSVSSSGSIDISAEEPAGSIMMYGDQQKQRKAVEKSRSFRTYNEDRENSSSVHNNMPSLPDLSLQLPRFGEFILNDKEYSSPSPPDQNGQCSSLGFEINDNNLVRSTPRAESTSNSLSPFCASSCQKNAAVKAGTKASALSCSSSSSACKLLTPASATMLPNLSPTNSIAEIEQTIDMIVKSPFVSVLRKPSHFTDAAEAAVAAGAAAASKVSSPSLKSTTSGIQRPAEFGTLNATQRTSFNAAVAEAKSADEILPPTLVTISPVTSVSRDKFSFNRSSGFNSTEMVKKEPERKSCNPVIASIGYCKSNTFGRTRRTSSIVESSSVGEATNGPAVPEFLKIQLNRVDPGTRACKSTVVFSKNARDTKESAERSVSTDDLSMRRCSNASIDIHENEMPSPVTATATATEKSSPLTCLFEAINKQTKSLSTSSIRHQLNELPPKSPNKKKTTCAGGALLSSLNQQQTFGVFPNPAEKRTPVNFTAIEDDADTDTDMVILRQKTADPYEATANKMSLQERKRLFMNEEKVKMDKKLEELKSERKKSINEELQRKSPAAGGETAIMLHDKEPISSVVLRKKCNSINHHGHVGTTNTNTSNPTSATSSNHPANNNNSVQPQINKEDSTPELMKVFARRSLKIKDEDLVHLAEKLLPPSPGTGVPVKRAQSGSRGNVDSDKENQSASEEKLDKLTPKFEESVAIEKINNKIIITNLPKCKSNETLTMSPTTPTTTTTATTTAAATAAANRSSLVKNGTKMPNSLALSNSNSNNNNNNNTHNYPMTIGNGNNHHHNNNNASNKNSSILPSIAMKTLPNKSYLNACHHHHNHNHHLHHHQSGRFNGGFRTISVIEQRNSCNDKKVQMALGNGNANASGNRPHSNSNNTEGLINNNNNNNHKHNSFNSSLKTSPDQRQSLCLRTAIAIANEADGNCDGNCGGNGSKTIERSATVSEFKGIHQRRAEWEQRAKEALK